VKLIINLGIMMCMLPFTFGCSSFSPSPDYEKIADKITEKAAKELKAQKNLYLIGTGGRMMDDIQMMAMSFNYYQEVNLKTARELTIYAVNEYLSAINNNKEIRLYLHEYPFTAKNIEITIFVYNQDRSKLPLEKICCIECINGGLEYYNRSNPRQAIYEETYEQASRAISSEEKFCREKMPNSMSAPPQKPQTLQPKMLKIGSSTFLDKRFLKWFHLDGGVDTMILEAGNS
jgi:hypothetical protein